MSEEQKKSKGTSLRQLGIILHPKNLLRSVAASVPGAASLLEIQSQIENAHASDRIESLEETDITLQKKLLDLEAAQPKAPSDLSDWPKAVGEYLSRIVDIAIVYDAGVHSIAERGRELFQSVAHGCFIGPNEVLTCVEAIELAKAVADHKQGRMVIISGMAFYEMQVEAPNKSSGLIICRVISRDEKRWARTKQIFGKSGVSLRLGEPLETSVKFNVTPWMGQEIGFIHTGEATDVMRPTGIANLQFDATAISHFRKPTSEALKTFVTNVLPGRIQKAGAPVFTRAGMLVGIISDTESYPSDAGRRAIVRSLLGHPRFTQFKKE